MELVRILDDNVDIDTSAAGKQLYDSSYSYAEYNASKQRANAIWGEMKEDERSRYGGNIKSYFKEVLPHIPNDILDAVKNYGLVSSEQEKRLHDFPFLNQLEIGQLKYEESLMELLENMENIGKIKDVYKVKKRTTSNNKNSGITTDEATRIRSCMRQGRELFLSGKNGQLLVKPLIYFYSLTAYAYATIILNNPTRFSMYQLPNSHGLAYFREGFRIQFGGATPHGTLTELCCSFPTICHLNPEIEFEQQNVASLLEYFKTAYTASVGSFFSMVPEIREYYQLVTGRPSRTHKVTVATSKGARGDFEFCIGDDLRTPDEIHIKRAFPGLHSDVRGGKSVTTVPLEKLSSCRATLYTDLFGGLWFIENPFFPLILPELCLHFVITCIFSNIMRYAPHTWGSIVSNDTNSTVSLMTRKYFSAFEAKFLCLILRNLSPYYPLIKSYVG